jgi:hypothetical protein
MTDALFLCMEKEMVPSDEFREFSVRPGRPTWWSALRLPEILHGQPPMRVKKVVLRAGLERA